MAGQQQTKQPVEVSGRVRAAATMTRPGGGGRCVVATTWQSDRSFPRTAGEAVPFEIETPGGEVFAVDPREAAVALPVRLRDADGGVRRETAWIAPGDEVQIAGDVVEARNGKPARILAHRIATAAAGTSTSPHRLPPRTLAAGRAEKEPPPAIAVPAARSKETTPAPVSAPVARVAKEPSAPVSTVDPAPAAGLASNGSPVPPAVAAPSLGPARRRKPSL